MLFLFCVGPLNMSRNAAGSILQITRTKIFEYETSEFLETQINTCIHILYFKQTQYAVHTTPNQRLFSKEAPVDVKEALQCTSVAPYSIFKLFGVSRPSLIAAVFLRVQVCSCRLGAPIQRNRKTLVSVAHNRESHSGSLQRRSQWLMRQQQLSSRIAKITLS